MGSAIRCKDTTRFWAMWPSALQKAYEAAARRLSPCPEGAALMRAGGAKKGTPKVVTLSAYD
eukprot:10411633-Alexandrium_andersonii.AAC.1